MGVPNTAPLPREKVTLSDGQVVEVRALSRAEAHRLGRAAEGPNGAEETEVILLAAALDATNEAVQDYLARALHGDVDQLTGAIMRLSGIGEEADRPT